MCGTGCLRISLGNSVLVPKFLYFYLGQPDVIAWIFNQAIGATMPNLNTEIIRSISISYPPLPVQHKIAAILSAYDDLLENNTRRIAILEEMAQLLYREWFVHFRFPGYEKIGIVETGVGLIPEGWEVKTLGDWGTTITGKTPSKLVPENFNEEYMPFIKTPDMHNNIFCVQAGEYLSRRGVLSQKIKQYLQIAYVLVVLALQEWFQLHLSKPRQTSK